MKSGSEAMKRGWLLAASIWICAPAFAETWTLRDGATGETFGPFEAASGAEIDLGGRSLVLEVSRTKPEAMAAKLKEIIVPHIEFRQANISDVVNFLVEASRAVDPEKTGTSIVWMDAEESVDPPPPGGEWGGDGAEWPGSRWTPPPDSQRTVTLNLRRVSLYDALSIIAEAAGLSWEIDASGVVMVRKNGAAAP